MSLKYHTDSAKILKDEESEVMGYMKDEIQVLIDEKKYHKAQKVSNGMKLYVNQILARQHYQKDTYHENRDFDLSTSFTVQAV